MNFEHLRPLAEELMPKAELFFRPHGGSMGSFNELIMNLVPTDEVAAHIFKQPYDKDFVAKWLLIKELGEAELLRRGDESFVDMRIEPAPSGMIDEEGRFLQADNLLFEISLLRTMGAEYGVSFKNFVYYEGHWYFLGKFGKYLEASYAELEAELAEPLAEARQFMAEREARLAEEAARHNVEVKFDADPEVFFAQFLRSEIAFASFVAESIITKAVAEEIFLPEIADMIDEATQREVCLSELAGEPDDEQLYYGVKVKKENSDEQMRMPIDVYRIEFIKYENSSVSEFKGWWVVHKNKWYVMLIGS